MQGEMDAWWKSPEAAKYHQPIDLTKEPPEEPPPERFDIEALYRQALLEKAQAAKVKVPPPPAPPQVTPDPEEAPAADETAEWPLYAITGTALVCLLWLHARQRRRMG